MGMGILLLRLLSGVLVPNDYDVFIISKQLIGWFVAFSFMGMATALPRTIVANAATRLPQGILLLANVLVLPSIVLLVVFAGLFPEKIAVVVFRDVIWQKAIFPLSLLTIFISSISLMNLYYRGIHKFKTALGLELLSQGIIPVGLVLFLLPPVSLAQYLYYYSALLGAISAILMGWLFLAAGAGSLLRSLKGASEMLKQLLNYGVPKLVSGVYQMCVLGLIPVALRWSDASLNQAAAAALGITLGVSASAILLTINSTMTFNDVVHHYVVDKNKCGLIITNLMHMAVVIGFGLVGLGMLGADVIIHYLIGPIYDESALYLNAGAATGFLYYVIGILEIPLDATTPPWKKARLSVTMLVGTLAVFVVIKETGTLTPTICISVIAMSLLIYACLLGRLAMKVAGDVNASTGELTWKLAASVIVLTSLLLVRLFFEHSAVHLIAVLIAAAVTVTLVYGVPYISIMLGFHRPAESEPVII